MTFNSTWSISDVFIALSLIGGLYLHFSERFKNNKKNVETEANFKKMWKKHFSVAFYQIDKDKKIKIWKNDPNKFMFDHDDHHDEIYKIWQAYTSINSLISHPTNCVQLDELGVFDLSLRLLSKLGDFFANLKIESDVEIKAFSLSVDFDENWIKSRSVFLSEIFQLTEEISNALS
jgi:hypothetical protein